MTDDMKDLQFLEKHEVLMRLATKLEKTRSNYELLKMVVDLTDKRPDLLKTAPPDIVERLSDAPKMEDEMLELRSIIHWLTKRREG